MQKNERTFLSSDGKTPIHVVQWQPETAPRAVVQIAHGVAEYADRYDPFAAWLTEQGFAVVAGDHIGHGQSVAPDAPRLYFGPEGSWHRVVQDLYTLREQTGAAFPGQPYFLLGHSMGSFLTRSYLIRYPGTVDACALLGTGQQPESVLKAGLAACRLEQIRLGKRGRSKLLQSLCFGAYNSQFKPNRTESDWVCSVDEVVDAYIADPFCQVMPTVTLMRDMLTGIRFNQQAEHLAKMDKTTPVFFLSGDQDPVGSNGKGVRAAYQSFLDAGCSHVRLKLYPGGRHEMLNEHNWQDVYDELLSWFDQQIK